MRSDESQSCNMDDIHCDPKESFEPISAKRNSLQADLVAPAAAGVTCDRLPAAHWCRAPLNERQLDL